MDKFLSCWSKPWGHICIIAISLLFPKWHSNCFIDWSLYLKSFWVGSISFTNVPNSSNMSVFGHFIVLANWTYCILIWLSRSLKYLLKSVQKILKLSPNITFSVIYSNSSLFDFSTILSRCLKVTNLTVYYFFFELDNAYPKL